MLQSYTPSYSDALVAHAPTSEHADTPALWPTNFDRHVFCILGLPFDAVDNTTALARLQAAMSNRTRCFLSTPNLNFVIASQRDEAMRNSILHSNLSIPDGMPIVWVARLLGLPIRERVAGSTLFSNLQSKAVRPVAVYFFGGAEGVAAAASESINRIGGAMRCTGYECPGYGSVEEMSTQRAIDQINASKADFLVVSLGARKGQEWIERNISRLSVPVVSHLGAVVNFVAGTVVRSPLWLQRAGLEWVWRIKEEPALLERYLGDGWKFLRVMCRQVIPYAFYLQFRKLTAQIESDAESEGHFDAESGIITLSGTWTTQNIDELRSIVKKCAQIRRDIIVDLSRVTYVDSAFIGMLMLLRKHTGTNGQELNLLGISSRVFKIFRLNGAEFLLTSKTSG